MAAQGTTVELRPSITTGQFKALYETVRELATEIGPTPANKETTDQRCRRAALDICNTLGLDIALARPGDNVDPEGNKLLGRALIDE